MKIILTESQSVRLIKLMENESMKDYLNDLDKLIQNDETLYKGIKGYSYNTGVAAIQSGLDKLGYDFGAYGVDGKFGNETEKNIKKFQEDEDLEVTGKMTKKDIEKLKSILSKKSEEVKTEPKKDEVKKTNTKKESKTTNGGTFIIDINDPDSNEFTVIWGGQPSASYGAKYMKNNGGSKYFSDKNVVYSNWENSLETLKSMLSKNGINDYKIKSVSGFSAGGTQAWKHINDNFDFVGLIDPTTKKDYDLLPGNVEVISNSSNWTGFPRIAEFLRRLENKKFKNVKKISIGHFQMPEKFYEMYSDRM